MPPWYVLEDSTNLSTPALLVHPPTIGRNLDQMVQLAGSPDRLRPHVKTHKLPQVVSMSLERGIRRFKASTIAELEMAVAAGARDVLLAMQPLGAHAPRLAKLAAEKPDVEMIALIDSPEGADQLNAAAAAEGIRLAVLLDLNVGMNRTGIVPGAEAAALAARIHNLPSLSLRGLHAYDGHIKDGPVDQRRIAVLEIQQTVRAFRTDIRQYLDQPELFVAGGTPTSFIWSKVCENVEVGAGTTVFWDAGQPTRNPEMPFEHAAVLATRVISRPAPDMFCLDLGHKAVASEMEPPRVILPELPDAEFAGHSEEHLVLRAPENQLPEVGTCLYGIPAHICPTVALHETVQVVEDHRIREEWTVIARKRRLQY